MSSLVRSAVLVALLALPTNALGAPKHTGQTTHTVYAGQTLGKIARRYRVSVDDLCRVNGIARSVRLRPGQTLVIPDEHFHDEPPAPARRSDKWEDYAGKPKRKGYVVLDSPTQHWKGLVLTPRGKLLPKATAGIEKMFASWRTGARHPIDARLMKLVATISDAFAGRPIRVVSGYRERSYAVESKHKVGRALDFSIPGVPNRVLRDYLRTLPDVGVGYYPNSTHVHVDVREAPSYWVDTAKPGEPPKYVGRDSDRIPPEAAANESPKDVDESEIWTADEQGSSSER